MRKIIQIFLLSLLFLPQALFGQKKKDKIQLLRADILIGRGKLRVLKGNVLFKQDETLMYTDSAYFYPKENALDAFGNVRIVQPDGSTITSRKLFYNGDTRLAKFRNKVILKNKTSTVYTEALDYNLADKTAQYANGATILNPPNTLTSKHGFFDSNTSTFDFKEDVKVVNPEDSFTIFSEHLLYNTDTKVATFLSPSTIITKGDTVHAQSGTYNTTSNQTVLASSKIISGDYIISGNTIDYNKVTDRGTVTGNVKMTSSKDSIIILGDKAIHRGDLGFTKVFGNAVMIKANAGGDTLYLSADTLVSVDKEKTTGEKKLLAYFNSKIFKEGLQAITDSLVYDFGDSSIYFYKKPVLWNQANQISADSIRIQLANGQIDKMYLNENCFLISEDSLKNFNQVKGRNMVAYFVDDTLRKVTVDGNSESIYFALEGDTALTGMNKVEASNMLILFKNNELSTISFIKNPEGVFTPPHLILKPDTQLKGFKWLIERRPTKAEVLKQKM